MTRARPRRTNDPEAMQQKILDVAASLFQTNGYNATSMKDLLRETGVSAGAMYHHFPTKKACGLRVIRERVAPAVRQTWIDPLATAHSTEEGIRAIFRDITDELETAGRVRGCPLNNLALELSLADPEYRAEIERIFRDWQDALSEKLRSDVSNKKVKNIDPDSFATMIVATYSGAMAIAKAEQDTRALRLCAQQLSAALGNPQSARAIRRLKIN